MRAYVGGLVTLTLVAPHDLACLPSGAGSLSLVHLLRGRSRICGVVTDAHRLDAACNGRLSSGSVVIEQCACFGGGRRSSMWPLRGSPVYCTGHTSFSQRARTTHISVPGLRSWHKVSRHHWNLRVLIIARPTSLSLRSTNTSRINNRKSSAARGGRCSAHAWATAPVNCPDVARDHPLTGTAS